MDCPDRLLDINQPVSGCRIGIKPAIIPYPCSANVLNCIDVNFGERDQDLALYAGLGWAGAWVRGYSRTSHVPRRTQVLRGAGAWVRGYSRSNLVPRSWVGRGLGKRLFQE